MWATSLWLAGAAAVTAQEITAAHYSHPTTRYPHGVLGDDEEWARLSVEVSRRRGDAGDLFTGHVTLTYNFDMTEEFVFEDTEPRLWDVTGDGLPEVVVVQSHADLGARLVVIGIMEGRPAPLAATPFIGMRNRWLAPIGAADLDGDGHIEIAYIDRPHLAKTLRLWRFADGDFSEVAAVKGVTNHRIGESDIAGGLRTCAGAPELIVADASWSRIMAVRFDGNTLSMEAVSPHSGRESFTKALICAK